MPKRELNVNLTELIEAMDQIERDLNEWYLDRQTGEVLLVGKEILRDLEFDEDGAEAMSGKIPDWQQAERDLAARIEADATGRYERIPENKPRQGYRLMEQFAATVRDPSLREKLDVALDGKGAFRRFRNVLYDYPAERRQWLDYERQSKLERASEWLASLEIESTWKPSPSP
jgi:hypothetical protein